MLRVILATSVLALSLALTPSAQGQTPEVGDAWEDYLRLLQISGRAAVGSFTVRPFQRVDVRDSASKLPNPWGARLRSRLASGTGSAVSFSGVDFRTFFNSGFPTGRNDGAVWQGKGITTAVRPGVSARWRALSISVRPLLVFNQNSSFELAPVGPSGMPIFAYPWRRIDLPQRFGERPFWTFDPGESELRLSSRKVSVGVSTRSLWWGPSIENAIVMSSNAPGIPHVFFGTSAPVDIGIGDLEGRWIWGRLAQSDYFDPTVDKTQRFLTGIVLAYSPDFLSGLTVGVTRVFYSLIPESGVGMGEYFAVVQGVRKQTFATASNPTGDDERDQLLSLFTRWVLPESGFEVYTEWSRNDHSWSLRDFLQEPEHSQGYTLGLQKVIPVPPGRLLAVKVELTHLERSATAQVRATPTYYTHHIVTQGYTQKGQVIGAGIGPGGNSQHLGVDLYDAWGRGSIYFERAVVDNDAYYAWAAANDRGSCCHQVDLRLGVDALFFVDELELGIGTEFTRELNRYFSGPDLWNARLTLTLGWQPGPSG